MITCKILTRVLQNCFWNLFSTSGLSQIFKIRKNWKFPSPFKEHSDSKSSWSLKTSFCKKNYPINSKTVNEYIFIGTLSENFLYLFLDLQKFQCEYSHEKPHLEILQKKHSAFCILFIYLFIEHQQR
jgi:hypothetical protein